MFVPVICTFFFEEHMQSAKIINLKKFQDFSYTWVFVETREYILISTCIYIPVETDYTFKRLGPLTQMTSAWIKYASYLWMVPPCSRSILLSSNSHHHQISHSLTSARGHAMLILYVIAYQEWQLLDNDYVNMHFDIFKKKFWSFNAKVRINCYLARIGLRPLQL